MINEFSRKESPLQGLTGLGGGIASRLLSGVAEITVDQVFSTDLWTGNSTTQTITNGIDLSGDGGLVWIKGRNDTWANALFDTERGPGFELNSATTGGHDSDTQVSSQKDLYQFNSNGYSIGQNYNSYINANGYTFVGWTFRKCQKFFDIVTYTGDGTTNRNIPHNLGSVPGFITVKALNFNSDPWYSYHRSTGNQGELRLSETDAAVTGSSRWANYTPTSSHFRGDTAAINVNGRNYVAYLFAHDEQEFGSGGNEAIIHCGSYSGASTGPTITTGFEVKWIIIKRTDAAANWRLYDATRGFTTGGDPFLKPNSSSAETTTGDDRVRPTSTGFQVCNSSVGDAAINNGSGSSYIYIAIA